MTGSALAAAIPHMIDVAGGSTGDEPRGPSSASRLAGRCATSAMSGLWHERALAIRGRLLGPDHADDTAENSSYAATSLIETS